MFESLWHGQSTTAIEIWLRFSFSRLQICDKNGSQKKSKSFAYLRNFIALMFFFMWIFANKNQLKLLFMCVGKWQEELFTFVEPSALSEYTHSPRQDWATSLF